VVKQKLGTLVLVVWHDAHAASVGWCDASEIDDAPCVIRTIGYLIPDAKRDHVTVAQSIAEDDDLYGVFCVPAGKVQSVQVL
jgi:hypothetical protein